MRSRYVIAPLMSLGIVMIVAMLLGGCGGGGGGGGSSGLELDSGLIASNGGTFAHTFLTVETFNYHCTVQGHTMTGSVVVQPSSGAATVNVTIALNAQNAGPTAYGQNPLQINLGDTVVWKNNDSIDHTVTSQ